MTCTPRLLDVEEWPTWAYRLKPQLAQMAQGSGGRYVADDIDHALWSGRMRAWVAEDGERAACLLLSEVIEYPRFKALRLVGCVGEQPREWVGLGPWVEKMARCMDCSRLEALHPPDLVWLLKAWSSEWRVFHTLSEMRL